MNARPVRPACVPAAAPRPVDAAPASILSDLINEFGPVMLARRFRGVWQARRRTTTEVQRG